MTNRLYPLNAINLGEKKTRSKRKKKLRIRKKLSSSGDFSGSSLGKGQKGEKKGGR